MWLAPYGEKLDTVWGGDTIWSQENIFSGDEYELVIWHNQAINWNFSCYTDYLCFKQNT
jgi:hypothetical protein